MLDKFLIRLRSAKLLICFILLLLWQYGCSKIDNINVRHFSFFLGAIIVIFIVPLAIGWQSTIEQKRKLVSAVGFLFCVAVLGLVALYLFKSGWVQTGFVFAGLVLISIAHNLIKKSKLFKH